MTTSSDPSSEPSIRSSERSLLGAIAGGAPIDPRRLGLGEGDRVGRYVIARELGRGGMGVVYLARDVLLDRDVALKVLDGSGGATPAAAARILREARASSRLAHPSIARIFDVGQDGDLAFLAMEHVAGSTLRDVVRAARRAPLDARETARIGAAIARGLAAAHDAGIIHRDLKPENVMLGDGGRVAVVDFGLATSLADRESRRGRSGAAGTPGYVAPELLGGAEPDARSDLFSLGVILRELAGARPGTAISHGRLARIVGRLTHPDPTRRPRRAADVALALERAAMERSPLSGAIRFGVAALVGALGVGAVLVPTWTGRSQAPSTPPPDLDRVAVALARPSAAPLPSIACPPFEVKGVAPPSVWLGAAAASLGCRRLAVLLGDPRVPLETPARLLGAPPAPVEGDVTIDPWADDAASALATSRARATASVVLQGRVERERGGFHVEIALTSTTDASRRGEGSAWDRDLAVAVAGAMRGLDALGAAEAATLGDPTRARWGVSDRAGLLTLLDLQETFETYASLDDAWARAERAGDAGGPIALALRRRLARLVDRPLPRASEGLEGAPAPADLAALTLHARGVVDGERDRARRVALADALADARRQLPTSADPRVAADSLGVEAQLRAGAGDAERSRTLALAAIAIDPEGGPWESLVEATYARDAFGSVGRAYAMWHPEAADAYNVAAQDPRASTGEERMRLLERAYLLSSAAPLFAANYGRTLIFMGRREEARAVAARLHVGSEMQRLAGDRLEGEIQVDEGRIAAAHATFIDILRRITKVGSIERGDAVVVGLAAELAHLLGREDELAALIASRFVQNPDTIVGGSVAASVLVQACAFARPSIARPCVEAIAALDAAGHFREGTTPDGGPFLRGAVRWVRGDVAGAAAAFRALGGRVGFGQRALVAAALEAAGDLDAAERVDDPATTRALFGGVSTSDARAALRAHARRDPRARAMARRVLDAWAGADARPAPTSALERVAAGG